MSGNELRTSPGHFRVGWSGPQCGGVATIWHNPCFNISVRASRMEQFAVQTVRLNISGRLPGVFQLNEEGMRCLLSRLRKISPPPDRGPVPPVANKKQRGVIVQMLDNFAESTGQTDVERRKGVIARNRPTSPSRNFNSPCATTGCSSHRYEGAAPAPAHRRDRPR